MKRIVTKSAAGAALAMALALSTAANAQLLGGGLGGTLGGQLPVGSVGNTGTVDAVGSVDTATRTVSTSARASQATDAATKPLKASTATSAAANASLTAPAVKAPKAVVPAVKAPAVAVPSVRNVVVVPAVPDIAVRSTAIVNAGIAPIARADVPAYIDRQYVVLQEDLRGTGVIVRKEGQQIVLEMPADVTFAFDKYNIQPRFYSVLSAVSQTLAKYPATFVDVYGHTDAVGSDAYNQVLSERRASSVANFLAVRSVSSARMHTEGLGESQPIASNASIQGRAANRRVEIVLTPYVN